MKQGKLENEEAKRYIEKNKIAPLLNNLLQKLLLEMPDKPVDFLIRVLSENSVLCLFSFGEVPQVSDQILDYNAASEEQLRTFVQGKGLKFIKNFKAVFENFERLRNLKIYYSHFFVTESEEIDFNQFPLAVPLFRGKIPSALQVISVELYQIQQHIAG